MAEIPLSQRKLPASQPQKNVRVQHKTASPFIEDKTVGVIGSTLKAREKLRNDAIDKAHVITRANYKNEIERLRINHENTIAKSQGEDVFKASDEAQENFRRETADVLAKYPEQFHGEFKTYSDGSANDLMKFGLSRQVREGTKLADKTFETNKGFGIGKVVFAANNPVEYEKGLMRLATTVREHGQVKGYSDELIEDEARLVVSQAVTATVSEYASNGDAENAKRINKMSHKFLTAEDKVKVNKLLKSAEDNDLLNRAYALVDTALTNHPDDPKAAFKVIQKAGKKDGKLFKQASLLFRAQDTFNESVRKREQDKQVTKIVANLDKGRFPSPKILNNLDGKNKKWVQQYMKDMVDNKFRLVSKPKVLNEALDLMRDNPEEFVDKGVLRYKPSLRDDDYAFLKKNHARMESERRTDTKKIQTGSIKIVDDLVSQVALKRGFDKEDEEYADLRGFAMRIHDEIVEANPKETNPKTIRKKVYAEMLKRTKPEELSGFQKFLNVIPFVEVDPQSEDPKHFDNFDPDAPAPEATFIDTVDSYWIDGIKKEFTKQNKPMPKGEALEKMLKRIQSKGHDITKPRK